MKTLRCFLIAVVLSCCLSTAAMAGDIQGVGFTVPPPPPPAAENLPGDTLEPGMLLVELLIAAFF
jgi:hypothetical protein